MINTALAASGVPVALTIVGWLAQDEQEMTCRDLP